jgi:hypothetical protein
MHLTSGAVRELTPLPGDPVFDRHRRREGLSRAVALILEDRREDGLRGVPPDAVREKVAIK